MRHFCHLPEATRSALFEVPPSEFTRASAAELLANGLGATLYCPATRDDLARRIAKVAAKGVSSMVLCLEDSVPDDAVGVGEQNLVRALRVHQDGGHLAPLLFVRVRSAEQITSLSRRLGPALASLTGFVLPKFGRDGGTAYLEAISAASASHGHRLFAMPVLESANLAHAETRVGELDWIRRTCEAHREQVLAVRIGATDLSGVYGLRRPKEMTIYDVRVVSAAIGDIVNVLGRADGGFTVTGPVWEYYNAQERIFRPTLRQTLFEDHHATELRARLLSRDMDGLIREVELDKANGLTGKTVIHPTHVPVVHALLVVSHEEYADAADVVAAQATGGASASGYRNKMNESKPHLAWARRTMLRAKLFGVARADVAFVDVLAASLLA
jgi:citrate lyase beta subunit